MNTYFMYIIFFILTQYFVHHNLNFFSMELNEQNLWRIQPLTASPCSIDICLFSVIFWCRLYHFASNIKNFHVCNLIFDVDIPGLVYYNSNRAVYVFSVSCGSNINNFWKELTKRIVPVTSHFKVAKQLGNVPDETS